MSDTNGTFLHHFDSAEQQYQSASLGMWLFLVTEIMFFGGLFLVYVVYRNMYPGAFADASHHLDLTLGGINTAVLISSSLTMALAVHEAQLGKRKGLLTFLILTLILGSVFLGIKTVEYADKFHHHLVPGSHFEYSGPFSREVEIYFSLYFIMTGLHATHMIVGVGLLIWLIIAAYRNRFSQAYYSPVEMFGLYWHFVDIVWIFLFPFLYLISRHA